MRMDNKYILFCWVIPAPGLLWSDGGGACPALRSECKEGRSWISLKSWLNEIPPYLAWWFGTCECFVKLPGAYCSHCCWALQKAAPSDLLAGQDKPLSLLLSVPDLAGSREPATSSCLSSSGSFSPAMWLNLAALTPVVTQHPASFSQSPLEPPSLFHFLVW